MLYEWMNWCRLCAKETGNDIYVFAEDKNFFNIPKIIQKYLQIPINMNDDIPCQICSDCYESIITLYNFTEKSIKVQKMYTELQSNNSITDLQCIRTKYKVTDDYIFDLEEESVQHNDVEFKILKEEWTDEIDKEPEEHNKSNSGNRIKVRSDMLPGQDKNVITQPLLDQNKDDEKDVTAGATNNKKQKKNKKKLDVFNIQYLCDICEKTFNSQRNYTIHMKFKHSVINSTVQFLCNICDKVFGKIQNLNEHQKLHLPHEKRKWYPCPHCDKKFTAFWYVSVHIRTVHEKQRSYVCEECGHSFATGDRLAAHKVVHTDLTPYSCPQCPKSFKCSASLKHHVDTHENTKYICSICGIQLNTQRILKRHMIVHSDIKKYKCNLCDKQFKRLDAFKHHLIVHTGLRPYQCPFCEQTFANGSNCRKHQKHCHPDELAAARQNGGKKTIIGNIPSMKQLIAVNEDARNHLKKTENPNEILDDIEII